MSRHSTQATAEHKLAVSKGEVARMLSVSIRTVERLVAEGSLVMVRIRGASRVLTSSVRTYLTRLEGMANV